MPRASGIEVLESMGDLPVTPPAIVISGYLDEAIGQRLARLAWVREVMKKPFDLMEFVRRMQAIVAAAAPTSTTTSVF
jgi:DNA-binding response OmpR family regulator